MTDHHHHHHRKWTAEEDAILIDLLQKHGAKNWKRIAALFCEQSLTHRESVQCLQRWRKALQPGLKKGKWSTDEDTVLVECVTEQIERGVCPIRWPRISQRIPGRTSKQCRERWKCNLDPAIVRGKFTEEEDQLILRLQARFGNRWALIAQNLPGRTENTIKSRFSQLRKRTNNNKLGDDLQELFPFIT